MQRITLQISGIAFLVLAGCSDDDLDDQTGTTTFNVALSPLEETDECADAGPLAVGNAIVVISADNSAITVEDLTVSGLSSEVTAALIHWGPDDVDGPAFFDLGSDPTELRSRTFTAANFPLAPPFGSPQTFDEFIFEMKAGRTYVNVYTDNCEDGEIRGQLD
jgi:hypothetical protein